LVKIGDSRAFQRVVTGMIAIPRTKPTLWRRFVCAIEIFALEFVETR
jgi:hypothetical protein